MKAGPCVLLVPADWNERTSLNDDGALHLLRRVVHVWLTAPVQVGTVVRLPDLAPPC